MDLFQFSETEILVFALILIRVSAFFVSWPIFGTSSVPMPMKILTSLTLTFILAPVVPWADIQVDLHTQQIMVLAIKEALVGVFLGFLCRLFFFAISIAGQIISLSMGLASAQILNPTIGSQGNVVEQYKVAVATLFFLAINGHHMFLQGMVESFQLLPLSLSQFNIEVFRGFDVLVHKVMAIGFQISAPVMIVIFFMNFIMGIIGRAVPQINVLITSLPANILVGLGVLIISTPLFVSEMDVLLSFMTEQLFTIMKEL